MNYLKILMVLLLPGILLGSNSTLTGLTSDSEQFTHQKTNNYQVFTQIDDETGKLSSSSNFHLVSFADLTEPDFVFIRNTNSSSDDVILGKTAGDDNLPTEYSLSNNYPNPFNSSTKIDYALPEPTHVTIEVYNVLGQKVETIVNDYQNAGYYSVTFSSSSLATGMYLYRIQTDNYSKAHKMLIIK